jgi:hypothetical protein
LRAVPLPEARIPPRHSYYFCASRRRGEWCAAHSIQSPKADAEIERAVASFADAATVRGMVEQASRKPAGKKPSAANARRQIARVNGEQEANRFAIKGKITKEQFDAHDRKLAGERRDLEVLPKQEPVIDPKILASAIAGLFAEFPYLSLEEQHALAHRTFVAFDVDEDGGVDKAVMRGEALAEIYATNGRRSSATK